MKKVNNIGVKNCTAFCPWCGADLYYLDGQCHCKNNECEWTCESCENH
ncbi:hypothetical protein [Brassicibacter mesophilus]